MTEQQSPPPANNKAAANPPKTGTGTGTGTGTKKPKTAKNTGKSKAAGAPAKKVAAKAANAQSSPAKAAAVKTAARNNEPAPKAPAQATSQVAEPSVPVVEATAAMSIASASPAQAPASVAQAAPESTSAKVTSSAAPAKPLVKSTPAAAPQIANALAAIKQQLPHYVQLMRLNKPIGSLLLLWPTLWSLWLAAGGFPSIKNLVIFVLGVWVMRSAGCVINDFADRNIDGRVKRTRERPLATGALSSRAAIFLFIALCLLAFGLVLLTNPLTIKLSLGGLLLAFSYPFMKRYTHLPQVVLGAAFAWGIPMAYAAEAGTIPDKAWIIYIATVIWTVAYDTFYAMVDRDDDMRIGVKSTAILFGELDRLITAALQLTVLYCLYLIGARFELGLYYQLSLFVAAGLFAYQQWLIRFRGREACFKAFLNNNWVGLAIFVGIFCDFVSK